MEQQDKNAGFFTNLFKYGKLPTLETNVGIDNSSIVTTGAALFIAAFLIILTWYTFKKLQ